jgi:hypothetical protein
MGRIEYLAFHLIVLRLEEVQGISSFNSYTFKCDGKKLGRRISQKSYLQ